MSTIGFHCSHEQIAPGRLLRDVRHAEQVRFTADPGWHAARLQEHLDQGWEQLYLHFVGQEQQAFIDTFGERVLPQLGGAR